eukprot:1141330-Pelagomonas_calceolata.AAC.7
MAIASHRASCLAAAAAPAVASVDVRGGGVVLPRVKRAKPWLSITDSSSAEEGDAKGESTADMSCVVWASRASVCECVHLAAGSTLAQKHEQDLHRHKHGLTYMGGMLGMLCAALHSW